jgi:hypothetical protein
VEARRCRRLRIWEAMDRCRDGSRRRRLPSASSWMSAQWEEAEWASHVWFWGRGSVEAVAVLDGDEADMVTISQ